MTSTPRRARAATVTAALLAVTLLPALHQPAASATSRAALTASPGPAVPVITTPGDAIASLYTDLTDPVKADGTTLLLDATSAQKAAAADLGPGVSVTWNSSGTPESVFARDGVLARKAATATPEQTARSYLAAHSTLLGITPNQVAGLQLVSDQPLADSKARAVLFQQRFGDLTPATRGMVTVGITDAGDVAYLSSSLSKADGTAGAATMSPLAGWLAAAGQVGRSSIDASLVKISTKVIDGWTRLTVPGYAQTQLVRLRAFPTADGEVLPAYEADIIDASGGSSFAYRVIVDADNGRLLYRENVVDNEDAVRPPVNGMYPGNGCSTSQPINVTDTTTKTIGIAAVAAVATDDIKIILTGPSPGLPMTFDTATSPEAGTYSAPGTTALVQNGTYSFQVCSFDAAQRGGAYTATVALTSLSASTDGIALPKPTWRAFTANPSLASTADASTPTNSVIECWYTGTATCSDREAHENVFSAGPWDSINGLSTMTTVGNNANTHEAWLSPDSPGGLLQAPVSATRQYTDVFTDAWNNNKCNPTNFVGANGLPVVGGNDILAVVTNLFTGHNRIHDFAYALGFTEKNYNLQLDNGGKGGQGGDQEIGNAQAGAISGGSAGMYLGRDNANQIALQDGVPGITNQYLFQPIAGAFYSPCADGALDTGIYGHEYTHAISNRMVGGPSDGLTSEQGGAMGESWSDLDAAEYQFENNYPTGTNPWALGAYATGNNAKGIRDYAINDNPLNYSDYGFDTTGPEVHADGEIWNGTQWEVRAALVDAVNAQYAYTDSALQQRCATPTKDVTQSQPSASQCPGNRRWLQLIYDAWLLQPGADSMLLARDTMLAADQMRFGGADQAIISSAFARRGMGADAVTTPDQTTPTPSFRSAYGNNSAVTFTASAADGSVYVGDYEARVRPIADLDPATSLPATASFTPGVYKMTYASPTRGFRRFVLVVPDNGAALAQAIDDSAVNVAGAKQGASIIGASSGSLNAESLIDGTENTNWGGVTGGASVDDVAASPATQQYVSVALAGGLQTVTSVKVSAALRPAPASATDVPLFAGQVADPDSGSRFTAMRKFQLQACTANCSGAGAVFTPFYTSPDDAFPGDVPRPVAPDLTMRSFSVPATQAAAIRLVAVENQCTGQDKYAGEQDQDPLNDTDCKTASDRDSIVHAAELQVFSSPVPADPTSGTPGDGSPGSGTAGQGSNAPAKPGQPILGGGVGTNPSTGGSGTTGTTGTAGSGATPVKTKILTQLTPNKQVRGDDSMLRFQVVSKGAGRQRHTGGVTSGKLQAGVVVVRIDGKKMRKAAIKVTLRHRHKVRGKLYRLPNTLSFGAHRIQVKFKPYDKTHFTKSKSHRLVFTVVRTLPSAS